MIRLINTGAKAEWIRHWPIAVTAMAGVMASHIHLYSMGVMIGPIENEFGWSRAQITSGLLIISFVQWPLSFLVGRAIDRIGPRKVALCGISIYSIAIAMLCLSQTAIWTWWLLWGFVAMGFLFLGPTVWVAAIARYFSKSRGLAIAVTLSSTGLVSLLCPIVTLVLIDSVGWRMAYVVLGLGAGVLAIPALFFFFIPREKSRADQNDRTVAPQNEVGLRAAITGLLGSKIFWRLGMAGPIMSTVFTALMVNFVPILNQANIEPAIAAMISGVIGAALVVGRLTAGALVDRFDARRVAGVIVLFPAMSSIVLLYFTNNIAVAFVAAIIFGLSAGAELDALSYLSSRHFRPENFGLYFGMIIGLCSLGAGLGPFLSSLVYDATQSYIPVLWAIVPLCIVSSLGFNSLPPRAPDTSRTNLS